MILTMATTNVASDVVSGLNGLSYSVASAAT